MNILKQTINNLDGIYNQIESASKTFKINYTYLNTLRLILNDAKLPIKDDGIRAFCINYNKTLDNLYKVCEKQSKLNNDKEKIHLRFVKEYIEIIKTNINQQFI